MDKWDSRWMSMAEVVSTWSKDPSTKVGAVIVKDMRLISQGWNGFPRGVVDDERLDDREVKYSLTVHAEMNAIFNAGYNGVSLRDSTLYVYGLPVCSDCAKGVMQTGITRVVSSFTKLSDKWIESGKKSAAMFAEAGIEYERFEGKFPWDM